MSAVVNGHREEGGGAGGESRSGSAPSRGRPPHGHILPMLSFSASTPTEDEDPLQNDAVLAIDSPLWEQPEVEVLVTEPMSFHHHNHDASSPPNHHHHQHDEVGEQTPLIPPERTVLLMDAGMYTEEEEEANERVPLLSGGGGGGGGVTGLSLPLNLSRRASSQIGMSMANGEAGPDMSTTIASFLRTRAAPVEAPVSRQEDSGWKDDEGLREVAGKLVTEVLAKAREQASTTDAFPSSRQMSTDERLMEVVRGFVSEIMARAKAEAYDSMCHIQNNNNNLVMVKEEAVAGGTMTSREKTGEGMHGLASPSSASGGRTAYRRGGPWYVQMGRVFSSFLTRICPCRCPTKP